MHRRLIFSCSALFALVLFSCHETLGKSKSADGVVDTLTSNIPKHMQAASFKTMKVREEKQIGVASLEDGFDGTQIRIYQSSGPLNGILYLLKEQKGVWSGDLYYLYYNVENAFWPGRKDSLLAIRMPIGDPEAGWEGLMDQLHRHHIFSLPDHTSIPGYFADTDDTGVFIEVAQKNKYRSCYYPNPNYRKKEFGEAANLVEILALLRREFRKI